MFNSVQFDSWDCSLYINQYMLDLLVRLKAGLNMPKKDKVTPIFLQIDLCAQNSQYCIIFICLNRVNIIRI